MQKTWTMIRATNQTAGDDPMLLALLTMSLAGVVYFLIKYWVDKYNLYFATLRPKFLGTTDIHGSSVNFAFSSGVMLQFVILFYSVLRSG